jgi:hypothetical protein
VGVIVSAGSGAVVKSGRPLKRARFPTTFTRLNCSVSKRNSSSCMSGCGLGPATSAQVVDLADLTVEGVGPVCDRRLTDAAKASSNSLSLSLSSSGAGPTTRSSSPARPIVWYSSGKPSEIA